MKATLIGILITEIDNNYSFRPSNVLTFNGTRWLYLKWIEQRKNIENIEWIEHQLVKHRWISFDVWTIRSSLFGLKFGNSFSMLSLWKCIKFCLCCMNDAMKNITAYTVLILSVINLFFVVLLNWTADGNIFFSRGQSTTSHLLCVYNEYSFMN